MSRVSRNFFHTHGYEVLDATHALEAPSPALLEILQHVAIVLLCSKVSRACMAWVRPEIVRMISFCATSVANEPCLMILLIIPL